MKLRRFVRMTASIVPVVIVTAAAFAYWRSDDGCGAFAGPPPADPMQAYVYCDYGGPEVMRLARIARPTPGEGAVLVRVHAVAVNPLDWHYLRGTPYVMRLETGLRKPAAPRLGVDFAGTVAALGPGVTAFAVGDEVFGGRTGAFAEYVVVRANGALVHKPANISFEQAAAVPIAAVTALQALRDRGGLRANQRVLVNGASGGVGTFAVQIARHLGAEVTGVCSTRNVELVRSLGAAHVIDYTREDFTKGSVRYDVLLDNVGNHPISACRRVLTPDGRYVLVGGGGPHDHRWLGPLGRGLSLLLLSPFVSQEMGAMLSELDPDDLRTLASYMEAGVVTPVIDRRYSFAELPEAIRYLELGRARGKVVVALD